jgi:SAM-dependent methyltransferase
MSKLAKAFPRVANIARIGNHAAKLLDLPAIDDLAAFLAPFTADSLRLDDAHTLDIGCGEAPYNPFGARTAHGVDLRADAANGVPNNVRYADLTVEPIPFDDSTFDFVTAFDFVEHVPRVIYLPSRRFPFVALMDEVWRVLRPGGLFLSHTPVYPYSEAFRDPTHTNIVSHETFSMYFAGNDPKARMYGFKGDFDIVSEGIRAPHLVSLMRKRTP